MVDKQKNNTLIKCIETLSTTTSYLRMDGNIRHFSAKNVSNWKIILKCLVFSTDNPYKNSGFINVSSWLTINKKQHFKFHYKKPDKDKNLKKNNCSKVKIIKKNNNFFSTSSKDGKKYVSPMKKTKDRKRKLTLW